MRSISEVLRAISARIRGRPARAPEPLFAAAWGGKKEKVVVIADTQINDWRKT